MTINRRTFIATAAGCSLWWPLRSLAAAASYPFTLGVASGYPTANGCVLWTRLAPDPINGGGMAEQPVEVRWEIARDDAFRTIAAKGVATATPDWGHSVHVEVNGLEPERWYWYRFHALGATSPVGRTRTTPPASSTAARLNFAFASCQQYEHGYYTAYEHMARDDLDLVVHVGDYIYEATWGRNLVRNHEAGEPDTLVGYRNRYGLYKSDPHLQAAHAAFPWLVTWDDHEVQNDYANVQSQRLDDPAAFRAKRAAAYQAYYEHMPLPSWARPRGPDMQLYTRAPFGSLAQFHVLDGRQYRSPQPCPRPGRGGSNVVNGDACSDRLDERLSYLGREQEQWLYAGLKGESHRWEIITQQTLMAEADRLAGPGAEFWTDGWDGYPRARARLLQAIAARRERNVIVIGGDIHCAVAANLKLDFGNPSAPVVASEFVGTSITSQGPARTRVETVLAENPHILYADSFRRGYTRIDVSADRCVARFKTVNTVAEPGGTIREAATFHVEHGTPGVRRA